MHHDVDQFRADLMAAMAQGKVINSIIETADGREILVTNSPMSAGGRVATHNDITERRRIEAKIAYMAQHDALTDLPNRLQLYEQLQQTLARPKRGEHVAVFCLDLDRFKEVNDTHGHPVGDLLLQSVAGRLRVYLETPIWSRALAGRVRHCAGGRFSNRQTQPRMASRLIEVIGAPYEIGGRQVTVELSIGIAPCAGRRGESGTTSQERRLQLISKPSLDGRGLYRFFEPDLDARMQARRTLEIDLRKAITNGEFELFYQPLVSI